MQTAQRHHFVQIHNVIKSLQAALAQTAVLSVSGSEYEISITGTWVYLLRKKCSNYFSLENKTAQTGNIKINLFRVPIYSADCTIQISAIISRKFWLELDFQNVQLFNYQHCPILAAHTTQKCFINIKNFLLVLLQHRNMTYFEWNTFITWPGSFTSIHPPIKSTDVH